MNQTTLNLINIINRVQNGGMPHKAYEYYQELAESDYECSESFCDGCNIRGLCMIYSRASEASV